MILEILRSLKSSKKIFVNTTYLSVVEMVRLVMPFVALPFIYKIVGVEKYGIIVFAQSIVAYFIVFINFGLDVSAVRFVSINRNNHAKLNEIVSSIMCVKTVLLAISFFLFLLLIYSVSFFKQYLVVFLVSFSITLSDVILPIWYFQGVEKMKNIAFIRLIAMLIYVIFLFVFLKNKEQYYLIPLFQSFGLIVSALISVFYLMKYEKIVYYIPRRSVVYSYFKNSIPFFSSRVSVVINTTLAKVISGFFFSMHDVAVFDLAQKIASTAFVPLQMLNQAIFPHNAKYQNRIYANTMLYAVLLMAFILIVAIYLTAPYLVFFFAKDQLPEAVVIVRVLCFYVFSGSISLYTGSPVLVAFGYFRPFNFSVILSTVIIICLYALYYLIGYFSIVNLALALGFSEFVIALYRLFFCFKFKIFSFHGQFKKI